MRETAEKEHYMKLHFIVDGKRIHEQDSTIAPHVGDRITLRPPASNALTGIVKSRYFNFAESTQDVILTLGPVEEK